mgnify:CR=1 FL=1
MSHIEMVVDAHDKEMLKFVKNVSDRLEKIFEAHGLELKDPADFDDNEASDGDM